MTTLAEEILKNFDRLPNPEQVEIALEILQRLVNFDFPPLTDEVRSPLVALITHPTVILPKFPVVFPFFDGLPN
jgi:hypothetical protein